MVVQTDWFAQVTGVTQLGESQMRFSEGSDRSVKPNITECTILVVDNDKAIVGLISIFGSRWLYCSTSRFSDRAITVAALHVGRIDLLLADAMMSGMPGLELAAYLNKRRGAVPVIYMSGYVPADVEREVAAAPLLTKPFPLTKLTETIRDLFPNWRTESPTSDAEIR